jgi:hypothetical protein
MSAPERRGKTRPERADPGSKTHVVGAEDGESVGVALVGSALVGLVLDGLALVGLGLDGLALVGLGLDGLALVGPALVGLALVGVALAGPALIVGAELVGRALHVGADVTGGAPIVGPAVVGLALPVGLALSGSGPVGPGEVGASPGAGPIVGRGDVVGVREGGDVSDCCRHRAAVGVDEEVGEGEYREMVVAMVMPSSSCVLFLS